MSRHAHVTNRYRTGIKWEVVRTFDHTYFEARVGEDTLLRVEEVQGEWHATQYDRNAEGDFDINSSLSESFGNPIQAFNYAELHEE